MVQNSQKILKILFFSFAFFLFFFAFSSKTKAYVPIDEEIDPYWLKWFNGMDHIATSSDFPDGIPLPLEFHGAPNIVAPAKGYIKVIVPENEEERIVVIYTEAPYSNSVIPIPDYPPWLPKTNDFSYQKPPLPEPTEDNYSGQITEEECRELQSEGISCSEVISQNEEGSVEQIGNVSKGYEKVTIPTSTNVTYNRVILPQLSPLPSPTIPPPFVVYYPGYKDLDTYYFWWWGPKGPLGIFPMAAFYNQGNYGLMETESWGMGVTRCGDPFLLGDAPDRCFLSELNTVQPDFYLSNDVLTNDYNRKNFVVKMIGEPGKDEIITVYKWVPYGWFKPWEPIYWPVPTFVPYYPARYVVPGSIFPTVPYCYVDSETDPRSPNYGKVHCKGQIMILKKEVWQEVEYNYPDYNYPTNNSSQEDLSPTPTVQPSPEVPPYEKNYKLVDISYITDFKDIFDIVSDVCEWVGTFEGRTPKFMDPLYYEMESADKFYNYDKYNLPPFWDYFYSALDPYDKIPDEEQPSWTDHDYSPTIFSPKEYWLEKLRSGEQLFQSPVLNYELYLDPPNKDDSVNIKHYVEGLFFYDKNKFEENHYEYFITDSRNLYDYETLSNAKVPVLACYNKLKKAKPKIETVKIELYKTTGYGSDLKVEFLEEKEAFSNFYYLTVTSMGNYPYQDSILTKDGELLSVQVGCILPIGIGPNPYFPGNYTPEILFGTPTELATTCFEWMISPRTTYLAWNEVFFVPSDKDAQRLEWRIDQGSYAGDYKFNSTIISVPINVIDPLEYLRKYGDLDKIMYKYAFSPYWAWPREAFSPSISYDPAHYSCLLNGSPPVSFFANEIFDLGFYNYYPLAYGENNFVFNDTTAQFNQSYYTFSQTLQLNASGYSYSSYSSCDYYSDPSCLLNPQNSFSGYWNLNLTILHPSGVNKSGLDHDYFVMVLKGRGEDNKREVALPYSLSPVHYDYFNLLSHFATQFSMPDAKYTNNLNAIYLPHDYYETRGYTQPESEYSYSYEPPTPLYELSATATGFYLQDKDLKLKFFKLWNMGTTSLSCECFPMLDPKYSCPPYSAVLCRSRDCYQEPYLPPEENLLCGFWPKTCSIYPLRFIEIEEQKLLEDIDDFYSDENFFSYINRFMGVFVGKEDPLIGKDVYYSISRFSNYPLVVDIAERSPSIPRHFIVLRDGNIVSNPNFYIDPNGNSVYENFSYLCTKIHEERQSIHPFFWDLLLKSTTTETARENGFDLLDLITPKNYPEDLGCLSWFPLIVHFDADRDKKDEGVPFPIGLISFYAHIPPHVSEIMNDSIVFYDSKREGKKMDWGKAVRLEKINEANGEQTIWLDRPPIMYATEKDYAFFYYFPRLNPRPTPTPRPYIFYYPPPVFFNFGQDIIESPPPPENYGSE